MMTYTVIAEAVANALKGSAGRVQIVGEAREVLMANYRQYAATRDAYAQGVIVRMLWPAGK